MRNLWVRDMSLSPKQRAALELFGFAEYVPACPDKQYRGRGGQWHDDALSFNDLVRQYSAEAAR